MSEPRGPVTEAGRRLLSLVDGFMPVGMSASEILDVERSIAAIEAAARADALAEVRRYCIHLARCRYLTVNGAGDCTCGLATLLPDMAK